MYFTYCIIVEIMFKDFIKKPSSLYGTQEKKANFWKEVVSIFFQVLLFILLSSLICSLISFLINPMDVGSTFDSYFRNIESFKERVAFPFLWIVIIGPIYEEISFRLGLSFKKRDFLISSLLIIFALSGGKIIFSGPAVSYFLDLGIRLVVLVVLFFVCNRYVSQRQIDYLKDHYASAIVYLFSFVFAALHISNYFPFEWIHFPLYILVTAVIFILAMANSYI